jgi:hypothetical protein
MHLKLPSCIPTVPACHVSPKLRSSASPASTRLALLRTPARLSAIPDYSAFAYHLHFPVLSMYKTATVAWQDKWMDWVSEIMHTLYPAVHHTIP